MKARSRNWTSARSRVLSILTRALRSPALPICVVVPPEISGSLSDCPRTVASAATSQDRPPGYSSLANM